MNQFWFSPILAAMAVVGCSNTATQPRTIPLAPGSRYVSLGSSFAAGAGIGRTRPDTPARCGRTTNNYASLLAARMRLTLEDAGCGGATTAHILGPWNELPPQIDAVTVDTRLVTLTAGGNDLNFVGTLHVGSCDPAVGLRIPGRTMPCPTTKVQAPDEATYQRLAGNLRTIASIVKARAPKARLVFVQYLTLVPPAGCPALGLSPESAEVARTVGTRLAATTAKVAAETGALLLPADVLSREHSPCDRVPWAKGRVLPGDASKGAPWHPNAAGHAAIAEELARKLGG